MPFDPTAIADDHCGDGSLNEVPLYDVLHAVLQSQVTGRLTIQDDRGENHVFFMRGAPVGVQLSAPHCPLGQLLLELRKVDSGSYMRAQRFIVQKKRMPGQVFKEIGVLDEGTLQEVLTVQARRRFEKFAVMRGRPFKFCRGLSFLSGFQRAALDVHVLLYLSQKGQLDPSFLGTWLDQLKGLEVRLEQGALPASVESYGFGPPETRFLERLQLGWQGMQSLLETGTLRREQLALLLFHLDQLDRLERRAPPAEPDVPATQAPPARPQIEEVFATTPSEPHAFLDAVTDPSLKAKDIHNVPTELPVQNLSPAPVSVPNSPSPATPTPVRVKFPSEETLKKAPPKKKKKKRTRRDTPEPSVGSSAVSRTKKEKTHVGPVPSIVIEGLDDDG